MERTKLVVRRLPPTLTEAAFVAELAARLPPQPAAPAGAPPLEPHGVVWLRFLPGRTGAKRPAPSLAYLALRSEAQVAELAQALHSLAFLSDKGVPYKPAVEYAPAQRVPRPGGRRDARADTLDAEPEYAAFLEALQAPPVAKPSAEVLADLRKPADGAEAAAYETPLMAYLRQRSEARHRQRSAAPRPAAGARAAPAKAAPEPAKAKAKGGRAEKTVPAPNQPAAQAQAQTQKAAKKEKPRPVKAAAAPSEAVPKLTPVAAAAAAAAIALGKMPQQAPRVLPRPEAPAPPVPRTPPVPRRAELPNLPDLSGLWGGQPSAVPPPLPLPSVHVPPASHVPLPYQNVAQSGQPGARAAGGRGGRGGRGQGRG